MFKFFPLAFSDMTEESAELQEVILCMWGHMSVHVIR